MKAKSPVLSGWDARLSVGVCHWSPPPLGEIGRREQGSALLPRVPHSAGRSRRGRASTGQVRRRARFFTQLRLRALGRPKPPGMFQMKHLTKRKWMVGSHKLNLMTYIQMAKAAAENLGLFSFLTSPASLDIAKPARHFFYYWCWSYDVLLVIKT